VRGRKQISSQAIQSRCILKRGELNLSAVLRRRLPRYGIADGAVVRDGDGLRARRYGELRLERFAVECHHVPFAIQMERPCACVAPPSAAPPDRKKPMALNSDVERVRSSRKIPLCEYDLV